MSTPHVGLPTRGRELYWDAKQIIRCWSGHNGMKHVFDYLKLKILQSCWSHLTNHTFFGCACNVYLLSMNVVHTYKLGASSPSLYLFEISPRRPHSRGRWCEVKTTLETVPRSQSLPSLKTVPTCPWWVWGDLVWHFWGLECDIQEIYSDWHTCFRTHTS